MNSTIQPSLTFTLSMVAAMGLIKDGKMGVSRERSGRIRRVLLWTRNSQQTREVHHHERHTLRP